MSQWQTLSHLTCFDKCLSVTHPHSQWLTTTDTLFTSSSLVHAGWFASKLGTWWFVVVMNVTVFNLQYWMAHKSVHRDTDRWYQTGQTLTDHSVDWDTDRWYQSEHPVIRAMQAGADLSRSVADIQTTITLDDLSPTISSLYLRADRAVNLQPSRLPPWNVAVSPLLRAS